MSGTSILLWGFTILGVLFAGAIVYYWEGDIPQSVQRDEAPPPQRKSIRSGTSNRGVAAIITAPVAWLLVGNALGPLGIILAFVGVMLGIMARERNDRMLGLWGIGIGLLAPAIVLGTFLMALGGR